MSEDSKLKDAVLAELAWEPSVTAAHIGVTAKDGIISLSGRVQRFAEKHAAQAAALRVKGVKGVAEEIEVKLPVDVIRGDDDIARAAVDRIDDHLRGCHGSRIERGAPPGNVHGESGEVDDRAVATVATQVERRPHEDAVHRTRLHAEGTEHALGIVDREAADTEALAAADPLFAAVKESSDDIRRITHIFNLMGEKIQVFTGVDNLALESLAMGAHGWVAGLVCAFPHDTVAIWKLQQAGRMAEALKIYRWFQPLLDLDVSARLVQNIKLVEALVTGTNDRCRAPRIALSGSERTRIEGIVKKAVAVRPALPKL